MSERRRVKRLPTARLEMRGTRKSLRYHKKKCAAAMMSSADARVINDMSRGHGTDICFVKSSNTPATFVSERRPSV